VPPAPNQAITHQRDEVADSIEVQTARQALYTAGVGHIRIPDKSTGELWNVMLHQKLEIVACCDHKALRLRGAVRKRRQAHQTALICEAAIATHKRVPCNALSENLHTQDIGYQLLCLLQRHSTSPLVSSTSTPLL